MKGDREQLFSWRNSGHKQWELTPVATKRVGGSRTQVSRPVHPEPGAPQGRPAHGHHKTQAVKKRLAEVAPCAGIQTGRLNPTADFAAIGRDYSPSLSGTRDREFLGCFTGMKAKRRTK